MNAQAKIISIARAAEILGCTKQNVSYLLVKGHIEGWQINSRCWAVVAASVRSYSERRAAK